ncbi:UDP-N-acetylglucosamine--N-acetylmuramyl-(pentapeptide) pyrophosphoryl-undecaprenol N-acetylglucosamine transferase [Rhodoligotrophos appendicifer]|uniref:undecaprenyldiphospho-muramoylpentapeptide beta-N-acetylglucosaminyltransferase n=1 Tax=Rhodoligotrophos appendicifer TaxID=987056 RepID=UPI001FEC9093|nr:undecaprenyldiphospho-muramoylpentapeptide beta-N-acetylglucosaminyltransferase [Rhodoligotrophos appendicifer]
MTMAPAAGRPTVVLAAGGTGGHLFPAQALAEVLNQRGYDVHLMTDQRGLDHISNFPAIMVHVIPSATIVTARPLSVPGQLWKLGRGFLKARRTLRAVRPAAVVGFGGYPSLPPLVAALQLRLPVVLHEQNAVMGKANRVVAPYARVVATAFPEVTLVPAKAVSKLVLAGNPVRSAVHTAIAVDYEPPSADRPFRVVVFGGSQGARIFSDVVPQAFAELPTSTRRTLEIVQQAREEDVDRVERIYAAAGIVAEVRPFYRDLADRMAKAQLVIARAGASTVSELGVIGRPAILVPLAQSLEGDQMHNARQFIAAGGGWLVEQSGFTVERMSSLFLTLRYDDEGLVRAAAGAKSFGRPGAARQLADLVESVARGPAGRTAASSTEVANPAITLSVPKEHS